MTSSYDELPSAVTPIATPTTVLTIGAHPDDAEFGAGATLARWAEAGATITMCIVTDGSKGSWDPLVPDADLIGQRIEEQEEARAILGAASAIHLGAVDGELVHTQELVDRLAIIIREVRPDVVLTHDPWQRYQLHPDHRATGLAAVDAVVRSREPRAQLASDHPAHRPDAILLWSADEPDHAEPATPEAVERKIAALLCHASQATTTMDDATASESNRSAFADRVVAWMEDQGSAFGVGVAETFKRLTP